MTTLVAARSERPRTARRWPLAAGGVAVAAVAVAVVASVVETGPSSDRIRNSAVPVGTRAEAPLWGFDHWALAIQLGAALVAVAFWVYYIRKSVTRGAWQPGLTLCVALTSCIVLDPYSNWAPYAAYDPALLHWPTTWAWVSFSPTIEPLFVIPGYVAAFLPPALFGLWLAQWRMRRASSPTAWVLRHPIAAAFAGGYLVGLVWDTTLELFFVHTGFYTYTQVISWGSINAGHSTQFPLLWEVPSVAIFYGANSALLWRDDQGRTIAGRFASRRFPRRQLLASVLTTALVVNLAFAAYLGFWTVLRFSRVAETPATPWRYSDTKIYDPQCFYEENGIAGPYFRGPWSGPTSAGRPCNADADGAAGGAAPVAGE